MCPVTGSQRVSGLRVERKPRLTRKFAPRPVGATVPRTFLILAARSDPGTKPGSLALAMGLRSSQSLYRKEMFHMWPTLADRIRIHPVKPVLSGRLPQLG
ncbi:hypothetical protein GGR01_001501 [Acetobacter oeni]|nr:hypothetical protein [Acetobacter oeni]